MPDMRLSVVLDVLDPQALVPFWETALGYERRWSLDDYEVLVPREGEPAGPVFILQRVSEPRVGKNRMHVDVHASLELGVPALVAQLEALGGTRVGAPVTELLESIGVWWQAMSDPEGNVFDVVADPGHAAP
jgi:predicted enzyme related to lactoylglutathione lyase